MIKTIIYLLILITIIITFSIFKIIHIEHLHDHEVSKTELARIIEDLFFTSLVIFISFLLGGAL